MTKKIRHGFSMIELLFVMVILAALAAIAIPSLSTGTSSATLTSMRSDANNIIASAQAAYVDTQDFSAIGAKDTALELKDADKNGYADNTLNGQKVAISKGNVASLTAVDCTDAPADSLGCFKLTVDNDSINKQVVFNSDEHGSIQIVTPAE